jgi:hypothetical protein
MVTPWCRNLLLNEVFYKVLSDGYLFILYFIAKHKGINNFKISVTNQGKDIYRYKNKKRKLHSCSVHIFFTQH